MRRRTRLVWLAAAVSGGLLSGYLAAYLALPQHFAGGGVRLWHVRMFRHGAQPYLFAPAGFMEAIFIRVARAFYRSNACGEGVELLAPGVRFRFRATSDFKHFDAPLADGTDILTFAASHPPFPGAWQQRDGIDGALHPCMYYDCDAEEAAKFLHDRYPRPFTVTKVIRWYEEAGDEATRTHLLSILAASRDPRAALVLGSALRSPSLEVRFAAVNGLNWEFGADVCGVGGGAEEAFGAAQEWLEENEARLLKEARSLPRN